MDLKVIIDVPENRVLQDRMSMLVSGWEWWLAKSLNVYVEPKTYTGMLAPYCFTDGWATSGYETSNYYRLHKTDYSFTYSVGATGSYEEHNIRHPYDTYLLQIGDAAIVKTTANYPVNRPFYLSVFVNNVGNDNYEVLNCGWGGNDGAGGLDLSLRFWSNGTVEVWRGTARLGNTNYITRKKERQSENNDGTPGAPQDQVSQETIDLLLVPFRRDELLIVSNKGAATFPFPEFDIDPNNPSPTIAASGQFWWYIPEGGQCSCAAIKFAETGDLVSHPYTFRSMSVSGQAFTVSDYHSHPGYGTQTVASYLYNASGTAAFETGVDQIGTIATFLTGDGDSTPFVYGAKAVFPSITASTPGSGVEVCPLTMSLNMSDSPADTKVTFTFVASSLDTNKLNTVGNRGVAVYLNDYEIFRGRSGMPKRTYGRGLAPDIITYECQDYWGVLDKYLMSNPTPFDGLSIYDAFVELVTMPGSCLTDIEAIDFPIPDISKASDGKWASLPDVGDTISTWLLKLKDAFCGNWSLGWKPAVGGPTFTAKSWATLASGAAVATLYDGVDSAIAGGVPSSAISDLYFFNSYDEQRLAPESNEVWVMWRHPKTSAVNRIVDWDPDSLSPTIAVSGRPDNWVGEPRLYASCFEPYVTTIEAAKYHARSLLNRLCATRIIGEWSCNFLKKEDGMPVWRGDCVQLTGIGKFRVTSLSAEFGKGRISAKYTGELCQE